MLEAPEGAGVRPGDRVAAICGLGGFAEQAAVDASAVFPLPDDVGFVAGSGLPMNYLTVHFALVHRGHLRAGETLLVHGAAGGVGTAGTQLARAMGARVLAVVSDDAKAQTARAAGTHEIVRAEGFLEGVRELTGGAGVDLVLDPVGGDRFTDSLRALAPAGRLLVLGFTGGQIPTVKVNRLLLTNTDVRGVGWGAYALGRPEFLAQQWAELLPHLRSGALDPPIGSRHPLERTGEAVAELDERRATGKVVVEVRPA